MRILCLVVLGLLTFLPTGWDLSLSDGQDELSSKSQDEPKDPKPNLPHQKIVKEFPELEYKHDMSRSAGKATKNTTENIRAVKNEEISETNKVKVKERKHGKSQDTHEGKPRKVKILKRIGKLFMKERKEKKKRKEKYKILYRKRKQKRNKWRRNKNKPKQCDSDVENECLQAAMDVYEYQRRNIFFFKRQDKIYSFIATIVKKLERKDDFWDIAKKLQVSIGGDIKNPNCRESDAANKVRIEKYVLNNYTTLLNCEADIQSKCTITNAVWDKDTKDQLDKCVCRLNKKPSKDCLEVFIDSEACNCWKTQKDNKYPGARECTDKSAETLKGITYIKKMCTAALVKCKDATNAAGSLIETCLVGEVRDNKDESETFEEFVVKYGKNYMPIEKLQRFAIWKRNTKATEKHNQDVSKTYRRSENFMSDMRLSEIKTRYMGLTPKVPCYLLNVKLTRLPMRSPLPRNKNWVNEGAVTQVQLQEGGTCWAHSAVGALEGVYHSTNTHSTTNGPTTNGPTTNRPAIEISVDYLIQCDTDGKNSKNQGNPIYAFTHVFNNDIPTKSEYDNEPSTTSGSGLSSPVMTISPTLSSSIEASCGVEKSVKIKGVSVYEGTENNIKSALQNGPVSAVMCATETFIAHKGTDIFEEQNCLDKCTNIKNHAVLIVGYGEVGDDRYWYVKNSWGTSWGDQGYFKISREESKDCGIISVTSRPIIGEKFITCATAANPNVFATVDEALNVTCCGKGSEGIFQTTCNTPEDCQTICGEKIRCYAPVDSPDAAECDLYDDENLALVGWGRWPCKRAGCPRPACNKYSTVC